MKILRKINRGLIISVILIIFVGIYLCLLSAKNKAELPKINLFLEEFVQTYFEYNRFSIKQDDLATEKRKKYFEQVDLLTEKTRPFFLENVTNREKIRKKIILSTQYKLEMIDIGERQQDQDFTLRNFEIKMFYKENNQIHVRLSCQQVFNNFGEGEHNYLDIMFILQPIDGTYKILYTTIYDMIELSVI